MTRVVAADQVQATAKEFARELANGPTITLGKIKQNLNRAENGGSLAECFDGEARNHTECTQTEDHKEAAAAFVEKKKPEFVGR